ncbi:unnamed protein product, partial [Amoebophrya sp. A25]|eukprot:GSA25T00021021001.1
MLVVLVHVVFLLFQLAFPTSSVLARSLSARGPRSAAAKYQASADEVEVIVLGNSTNQRDDMEVDIKEHQPLRLQNVANIKEKEEELRHQHQHLRGRRQESHQQRDELDEDLQQLSADLQNPSSGFQRGHHRVHPTSRSEKHGVARHHEPYRTYEDLGSFDPRRPFSDPRSSPTGSSYNYTLS